MAWRFEFTPTARRQLNKLDSTVQRRILGFLETQMLLNEHPREAGSALKGSELGSFWRYRVGDYRIMCKIEDERWVVLVVRVAHRREVYR
jgi:mRNA interferase RelE/StbE